MDLVNTLTKEMKRLFGTSLSFDGKLLTFLPNFNPFLYRNTESFSNPEIDVRLGLIALKDQKDFYFICQDGDEILYRQIAMVYSSSFNSYPPRLLDAAILHLRTFPSETKAEVSFPSGLTRYVNEGHLALLTSHGDYQYLEGLSSLGPLRILDKDNETDLRNAWESLKIE